MGDRGPTARFAGLVRGPGEPALDEACLLIAAHARPELDVAAEIAKLDELAAACDDPTFDGWRHLLFVAAGFVGNTLDYHDPDNSFLDQVLRRRTGLPITLAILGLEVGRRLEVPLVGVGMPGHFLLLHEDEPRVFVDAFDGGRLLDLAACEARFREIFGADAAFDPVLLRPVAPRAILARVLANLRTEYARRHDLSSLTWVLRLRLAIPGMPWDERRQLAEVLARAGQFGDAAAELELLCETVPSEADDLQREAAQLRARLN